MKLGPELLIRQVAGRRLLYVMAAEAEYGEHLQKRFTPLFCGIGPVEAAVAVTATLAEFAANASPPDLVVSLGSAGSSTLEHGAVYQAKSVSWRDMDASVLGVEKGVTPLLELPAELELPIDVPGIPNARLSTGANVVSGAGYGEIDADMVDMETYAILRACMAFGTPLVAIRGISDGKSELRQMSDWSDYLHLVDEKLAAAIDRLEEEIAGGLLD